MINKFQINSDFYNSIKNKGLKISDFIDIPIESIDEDSVYTVLETEDPLTYTENGNSRHMRNLIGSLKHEFNVNPSYNLEVLIASNKDEIRKRYDPTFQLALEETIKMVRANSHINQYVYLPD